MNLDQWKLLAVPCGLLLPYAVVGLETELMKSSLSDHAFYLSGDLARWDGITTVITLVVCIAGLLICLPGVRLLLEKLVRNPVLFALALLGFVMVALFQLPIVFVFRFWCYVRVGGIL